MTDGRLPPLSHYPWKGLELTLFSSVDAYFYLPGYSTLIRNYVDFLHSKLRYHNNHPEFNGNFDYKEYISLKGIDDPNEG